MYPLKSKKIIALISCVFTLWVTPSLAMFMKGNLFAHNLDEDPRIPDPKVVMDGIMQQYQALARRKDTKFKGVVNVITYFPERQHVSGGLFNEDALAHFQKGLDQWTKVLLNGKVVESENSNELVIQMTGRFTNAYNIRFPQDRKQMNHLARFHFKPTESHYVLSMINIVHGKHHVGCSDGLEAEINAEIETLVQELKYLQANQ
ncbi:uncharacterized protein MELLADRAFT_107931 [Melampsora larici-populina 98AG31]|uniref:Uncharacterized protein n=1 Tax=Melampsora larici-populina (strain 98AG31 / pathotype 3-4-7) TaxID=747676 RepID=F4RRF1_MELLP|nr:uncharacterized protein MELLADRAFT_107931 [Melampsora larici-populina 98AG31]EGG05043.1 hypothetical protein MELLADRAFT_107931 [Melampsora larici-populina 98AG31]